MTIADPKLEILTRLELYFSVRHTARTMRLFAEVMDYDYDCVVIFLSVAEVCFQAVFHLAPIEPGPKDIERLYSQVASSGLSIMTIAEITGIPRETARRKVKKLVDDGYLSISDQTKNIYLPISVVISSKFYDRFDSHIREASQLVRSISYYSK
jgi:CRP-like cAMP-binding protein